jgi:hypothetical protein
MHDDASQTIERTATLPAPSPPAVGRVPTAPAPPAALVPQAPDPAVEARKLREALTALDHVRHQLDRTRRSLDAFISQITHIPDASITVAPLGPVPAPVELPPAPVLETDAAGTPVPIAQHLLGQAPADLPVPSPTPTPREPAAVPRRPGGRGPGEGRAPTNRRAPAGPR